MANQDQRDEIEALEAMYDGSEDVILRLPDLSPRNDCVELALDIQLEAKVSSLELRLKLPPNYLASDIAMHCPPQFELLSSRWSRRQLSQLCQQLDIQVVEQGSGPILLAWFEWLRVESTAFLEKAGDPIEAEQDIENECEALDTRAIFIFERTKTCPDDDKMKQAPQTCANCCSRIRDKGHICLSTCQHTFCVPCVSASVQIHTANLSTLCCLLPHCQKPFPYDFVQPAPCIELWGLVSRRVIGTPFQEALVFCPRCEDRGMDMPVLTTSDVNEAALGGVSRCRCFNCGWGFCGICRSPCHPGESCYSDNTRVVRMAKRRPPLPPELAEMAANVALEVAKSEKEKAHELREVLKNVGNDFELIRKAFLDMHEDKILSGLQSVLGDAVTLTKTPLATDVQKRFVQSVFELPQAELRPAFHGTNAANHRSIFQRGLLIPGQGNELRVIHGAAHGTGVYTANVDAAWLSRGFCTAPKMLVCAVLQTDAVRHVGDAMVVGKAEHVAPLFEAASQSFGEDSDTLQAAKPVASVASKVPATPVVPATSIKKGKSKGISKEDKASKFKARLIAKSQRH